MVPCHTGIQGSMIDEPCVNGDPNFRSMGLGVETAAAGVEIRGNTVTVLWFRTNNPHTAGDDEIDISWASVAGVEVPPVAIDSIRLFDEPGSEICSFSNVPPRSSRSCLLTPAQSQQFLEGRLEVEFEEKDDIIRSVFYPANMFIFADSFESGDTTRWSVTAP